MKNSNIFPSWISRLYKEYNQFIRMQKDYHCKIISAEKNPKSGKTELQVRITGIKNQIIKFLPEELVADDNMLLEFSQPDVRAITFYALRNSNDEVVTKNTPIYSIKGQEFLFGKTIFLIKKLDEKGEIRKSAHELYSDPELLNNLSQADLLAAITTAIQERSTEDMEIMNTL